MKLAIGIILLLVALWFSHGTTRMWPPGRYRPTMLWPSTKADILRGVLLVGVTCGAGVALIRGASWWWLLIAGIAVVVWAIIEGVLRRRRAEDEALGERTQEIGEDDIQREEQRQELLRFLTECTPLNMQQQEIADQIANAGSGLPRDQYERNRIVSERLQTLGSSELDLLSRLETLSPPDSCVGVVDKWMRASQLRLKSYPLLQQQARTDDRRIAKGAVDRFTQVDQLHRAAEKELRQLCEEHNIQIAFFER